MKKPFERGIHELKIHVGREEAANVRGGVRDMQKAAGLFAA
jgi:hypothetical protein